MKKGNAGVFYLRLIFPLDNSKMLSIIAIKNNGEELRVMDDGHTLITTSDSDQREMPHFSSSGAIL
jgi:hypothetical protein